MQRRLVDRHPAEDPADDDFRQSRVLCFELAQRVLELQLARVLPRRPGARDQRHYGTAIRVGAVVFFRLDDGLILALRSRDAAIEATTNRLGAVSIGHLVDSKAEVDALVREARALAPSSRIFVLCHLERSHGRSTSHRRSRTLLSRLPARMYRETASAP